MGNSLQEPRREFLRQIAKMCRSQETEADWSAILGEAARTLGARAIAPPLPDLSDPGLYLDFLSLLCVCVPLSSLLPCTKLELN